MILIYQQYLRIVSIMQTVCVPILLLLTRVWVAMVFWRSGYLKLTSWDSTLYLFELEYQVPLLPWQLAAYLGTAAELILPVFLLLGLFTRLFALQLFVFNIIAVISYPALWPGGFYDHQLWGLMLLINLLWGAGPYSLDKLLSLKFAPNKKSG